MLPPHVLDHARSDAGGAGGHGLRRRGRNVDLPVPMWRYLPDLPRGPPGGQGGRLLPFVHPGLRVIYDKNEFNNEEGAGGDGDAEIAVVAEVPPPAEVEGVETAPERIVQDSDTDVEA